ncbi:MAG: hypothetical protein IT236_04285 [Bacteroidia bacterium]|nr:hypothetical protein [Bacteroidia bacterium]
MESYIVFRKIVELEKNKDYSFRIPSLFNPNNCEFIFELQENQFKENLLLELNINTTQIGTAEKSIRIPVNLNSLTTTISIAGHPEIKHRDYLLLACKSNQSFQFALSIIEKN